MSNHRSIERWFYLHYVPFIFKFRWIILLVTIVLTGFLGYEAAQLKPTTTPTQFFPDDYPLQKSITLEKQFAASDSPTTVELYIGFMPADRAGSDLNNATDFGFQWYNSEFAKFGSVDDQKKLLDLCARARKVRGQVLCFQEELANFVARRAALKSTVAATTMMSLPASATTAVNGTAASTMSPAPTSTTTVATTTGATVVATNSTTVPPEDYIKLAHELAECQSVSCGAPRFLLPKWSRMVRFARDDRSKAEFKDVAEFKGVKKREFKQGDLLGIVIVVNTTLDGFQPNAVGRPLFNEWEAFVADWNKDAPPQLQIMQFAAPWAGMEMDRQLQQNALSGIGSSMAVVAAVLLISSMNWIVTVYSVLVIAAIVACYIGILVLLGFTLGIIESVALSIAVGLSVDFVAHIAIGYNSAPAHSRLGKVRGAMVELGISVFSAAITTLGSGALLLGTVILFFFNFGLSLVLIIALAMVFAFTSFVAVMLIVGPEGRSGDMLPWFKKCIGKGD